ncbi:MAG: dephospho-CoA kinase [Acholeplasmataceae bacterium]|nr:dephospho-CoA kinase [Acholeplasmataceae bacterium]
MSVPNVKNKPYIIGLTGGIASGKSVAANYFKKSGIVVLDSDLIVQHLWQTNDEMVRKIEALFDFEIKTKQDRKRISQIIFNDRKMRLKLNDIVHPLVFLELEKQLAMHQDQKLIVVDMPLLFEVGYEKKCDVTCLVYTTEEIQIERLMIRDQMSKEDAFLRLKSQMSIEEKKLKVDIIFDNQGDLNYLYYQIDQFLKGFLDEE